MTETQTAVHGVLLEPLPYPRPDRLVALWEVDAKEVFPTSLSVPNFEDWKAGARSFAGIAVGTCGALALSRVLAGLLFGVSARDPLIFAGVVEVAGGEGAGRRRRRPTSGTRYRVSSPRRLCSIRRRTSDRTTPLASRQ